MNKLLYFSLSITVISVGLLSMQQHGQSQQPGPMVKLVSNDNQTFELPKDAAELSPTLRLSIEMQGGPEPLSLIDGKTLSVVVEILKALHEKIVAQEMGRLPRLKTIKYSLGQGDKKYEGYVTKNLQELVDPLMRGANAVNTMTAFDFLGMPALANAACQRFVVEFLEKNPTIIWPKFMEYVQELGVTEALFNYAKKHFRLRENGYSHELTIADYIVLYGMPGVSLKDGLRTIDLAEQGITSLDGIELLPLDRLQSFNLADDRLIEWDSEKFNMLKGLENLCLSGNSIAQLEPDALRDFIRLRKLDLSYNKFIIFPFGLFQPLIMLENLSLSGNMFSIFDTGIFQGLAHLRELNLSKNDLRALSSTLFNGLTELRILDLSGNQLFRLPQEIFQGLPNLRNLDLNENLFSGTEQEFRQRHGLNNNIAIEWGLQEGTESRILEEQQEEEERQRESRKRARE